MTIFRNRVIIYLTNTSSTMQGFLLWQILFFMNSHAFRFPNSCTWPPQSNRQAYFAADQYECRILYNKDEDICYICAAILHNNLCPDASHLLNTILRECQLHGFWRAKLWLIGICDILRYNLRERMELPAHHHQWAEESNWAAPRGWFHRGLCLVSTDLFGLSKLGGVAHQGRADQREGTELYRRPASVHRRDGENSRSRHLLAVRRR